MGNIISAIFQAILLFVLNIILVWVVDSFSSEKGLVFRTGNIALGESGYEQYIIRNQSQSTISGIILSMPSQVKMDEIKSSSPISASFLKNSIDKKFNLYRLDQIPPKSDVAILIPVVMGGTDAAKFINTQEVGLGDVETAPKSKMHETILTVLFNSLIIALFFGHIRYKAITENELARKRGSELDEEIKTLRGDMKLMSEDRHKMKVLLVAKIADYRKELEFWRTTAAKALEKPLEAKSWAHEVSSRLKTYSTTDPKDDVDIEYIKVAASLIGNVKDK